MDFSYEDGTKLFLEQFSSVQAWPPCCCASCVLLSRATQRGQLEMTRDQPLWLLVVILAIVPSSFQEGCFMSSHLILNSSSVFEQNISIMMINVSGISNITLSKSARFILQVFLIDITFTCRIFLFVSVFAF